MEGHWFIKLPCGVACLIEGKLLVQWNVLAITSWVWGSLLIISFLVGHSLYVLESMAI